MEITLEELLESRDNRRIRQSDLIDMYGKPLISLTIVMPGPVKKNKLTSVIASNAVEIIKKEFASCLVTGAEYDLNTGFEALYVISIDKKEAKRIACAIEDGHPMGRLFDIDVIGEDKKPVTREQINKKPRKCLVCEQEAHICMRNRTHSLSEIMSVIESLVNK
jgi:holo-ACP synthase CitX